MFATIRLTTLVAADTCVLVLIRPDVDALQGDLAHPQAWFADAGADGALAAASGAVVWLAAAWIGLGLLAASGARLPGAVGGVAGACARVLLPRALARILAGSAGLGVLLAPVVAEASTPPAAPPASASAASASPASASAGSASASITFAVPAAAALKPSVPTPVWPVTSPAPGPSPASPAGAPTHVATPTWPDGSEQPVPHHGSKNHADRTDRTQATTTVRVRPGDSLWLLSARRLGGGATDAEVAHYWPGLYAANRRLIGSDPGRIVPGQSLHEPRPTAQETP